MQMPISKWIAYITHRRQWPTYVVFMFALAVGYAHHCFMRANDPSYDYLLAGADNTNYHRWAGEIAQTFWLGWDRIPFTQGPLYPYYLAAVFLRFGISYDAGAVSQVFLGAANVALIFVIARRLFGATTAWVAGIVAALSPNLLLYQNELLPETLIVFVNLMFLRALVVAGETKNAKHACAAGFWLALCAIGRPNALLVAPLLIGWLWWTSRSRRDALITCAAGLGAMALTIAPVSMANYFAGGQFALITKNASWNLYIGNAPDSSGTYARPQSMWDILIAVKQHEADINWWPALIKGVQTDPWSLPRHMLRKTVLFWQSGELPQIENIYLKEGFSPFLRIPWKFGVVAPIGLVGIVIALLRIRRGAAPPSAAALAIYVLLFSASIIFTFVIARLRMPVLTVLILFAAYAIVEFVRECARTLAQRRVPFRGIAIAAACSMLMVALKTRDEAMLIRWGDYYNLGSAYEARDKLREALEMYDRALLLNPQSVSTQSAKRGVLEALERESQTH